MRINLSLITISFLLLFVPFIRAQQEPSVEDLFLKDFDLQMQNIERQVLKEQALEGDRDMKLSVLTSIKEMIENNQEVNDPAMLYIVESLTLEGTAVETKKSGAVVNYYPLVRRQATRLLGEIGSPNSVPTLLTALMRDSESIVRAEAAYALGAIGSDDQAVLDSLALSVRRIDPVTPDNGLATAILVAVEDIAKKNQGIYDPVIMTALVQIATGNYYRQVREKAMSVLEGLRQYR